VIDEGYSTLCSKTPTINDMASTEKAGIIIKANKEVEVNISVFL
jgi:hypothetical protein